MVEPLGIEPSSHVLQTCAITRLAQVPFTQMEWSVKWGSNPPIGLYKNPGRYQLHF